MATGAVGVSEIVSAIDLVGIPVRLMERGGLLMNWGF